MTIREIINKIENEKKQLADENKLLKEENRELKRINATLVKELDSYKAKEVVEVKEEDVVIPLSDAEAEAIVNQAEETKVKKSRKKAAKKTDSELDEFSLI